MENEKTEDQFSEEVEDRLQNLFGEEEPPAAAEQPSQQRKEIGRASCRERV